MSYGIKISDKGIGVDKAGDPDFVINSLFPTLTIHKTGTVVPDGAPDYSYTYVEHGLDYTPLYMTFVKEGSTYRHDPSSFTGINDTNLSISGSDDYDLVRYYIFKQPMFVEYQADIGIKESKEVGTREYEDESYGVEVSPKGNDVESTSKQDLNFTSKAPLQSIHKQGYSDYGDAGWDTINHNLGYIPLYFAWGGAKTGYKGLFTYYETYQTHCVDEDNLYLWTTGYGDEYEYAYLILKDPF